MTTMIRRSRKVHACPACGFDIAPGEWHWSTSVLNGKPPVRVHKSCGGTREAHEAYRLTLARYAHEAEN